MISSRYGMMIKLALLLGLICTPDGYCYPPAPPIEEMPIWASYYDPALCYDENGRVIENINCDDSPDILATSVPTADYYGIAAACYEDWIGMTLVVYGIGERPCLDTGGAIKPTYRMVYDPERGFVTIWVIVVDFLEHHNAPPTWQYGLFYDWELKDGV